MLNRGNDYSFIEKIKFIYFHVRCYVKRNGMKDISDVAAANLQELAFILNLLIYHHPSISVVRQSRILAEKIFPLIDLSKIENPRNIAYKLEYAKNFNEIVQEHRIMRKTGC